MRKKGRREGKTDVNLNENLPSLKIGRRRVDVGDLEDVVEVFGTVLKDQNARERRTVEGQLRRVLHRGEGTHEGSY